MIKTLVRIKMKATLRYVFLLYNNNDDDDADVDGVNRTTTAAQTLPNSATIDGNYKRFGGQYCVPEKFINSPCVHYTW